MLHIELGMGDCEQNNQIEQVIKKNLIVSMIALLCKIKF